MSNAWIFSSNPEKYDLLAEIEAGEVRPSAEDAWQANQRRRDMHPGDIVYHWVTGTQAGIYAVSRIVSEPYEAEFPSWPSHHWWVDLRYDQVLSHPLLKADLETQPVLKDLTILRVSRQTNYLLTPEQAEGLQLLVRRNKPMKVNEMLLQEWVARFRAAWKRDEREKPEGYTLLIHADEHRRRIERAQRLLTIEHIPALTLEELQEMLLDTDAGTNRFVKPKIEESLTGDGPERIRAMLSDLIAAAERHLTPEHLRRAIDATSGLGVLAISEFLTSRFPDRYWIYNSSKMTLSAFQKLGLDVKAALPRGQKSDVHAYLALQEPMDQVVAALRDRGFSEADYYFADLFLWFVEKEPNVVTPRQLTEIQSLSAYLSSSGFHFPDHLLATYYLSLQTKPFAILTGVSGTGKTKLAQLFAEWMSPTIEVQTVVKETPVDDSESFYLEVRPSYLGSGFVIPKRAYVYFEVPDLGETITILVQLGETGEAVECSLRNQPSGGSSYVYFFSKKRVREWLGENFEPGDILQFQVVDEGTEYKLNKFTPTISRRMVKRTPRLAFISVRPDWTDNRGLLGFYNLITHAYQTTDFLHLLVQATLELDMPHFVILDEMNLAKVEYYFADFLSVLESRYIQEGELKQSPLRLHDLPRCVLAQGELLWGEEAELEEAEQFMCHVRCDGCPLRQGVDERQWSRGESGYDEACKAGFDPERYVPPRLFVPHNVYFSGTVNVDETTYMFSPKVLDRANTIEFDEVDLEDYFVRETVVSDAVAADDTIRAAFTFNGEFTLLPKAVPIRTDEDLTPYRGRLIALNNLLQPYNMHFGYRVADEVLLYLWNARKLNDPAFELEVAFDHQLCQKVLPKFHGSQAKLQDPLEHLLLFCSDPGWQPPTAGPELDATDRQRIRELKGKSVDDLRSAGVRYPRAASKIRRMLDALEKEGFASFA